MSADGPARAEVASVAVAARDNVNVHEARWVLVYAAVTGARAHRSRLLVEARVLEAPGGGEDCERRREVCVRRLLAHVRDERGRARAQEGIGGALLGDARGHR